MKKYLRLVPLLLVACSPERPTTTRVVSYSGGLNENGYADVITISGSHSNGQVIVNVNSTTENLGSYDAYIGSSYHSGLITYQGQGIFRADIHGGSEFWFSTASSSQVMLSAGSLGLFVINL